MSLTFCKTTSMKCEAGVGVFHNITSCYATRGTVSKLVKFQVHANLAPQPYRETRINKANAELNISKHRI